MSRNLETRVRKLMDRMGDPNSVEVRVRAMSDEELSARLRELMVQGGYDPNLPHEEALAAYVAQLEAEASTLTGDDQALTLRIAGLIRRQADCLPELFPESPRHLPTQV